MKSLQDTKKMNKSLSDNIHQEIDPFEEENWVDEDLSSVSYSGYIWIPAYEHYGSGDPVGSNNTGSQGSSGTRVSKGNFDKAHERVIRGCHDKVYHAKSKVSTNFIKSHRKTCYSHK